MNLYIHVPFCVSRCTYCDFYTLTGKGLRQSFVPALLTELRLRRDELPEGESIEHIYFGGGTPSQLSIEELRTIFATIAEEYPTDFSHEITIECNPDDLTEDYVQGLTSLPINRVSMGVQSFFDEDLRFLNRRHTSRQVSESISLLQHAGITNLSIDLIYGLPDQTLERWSANIEQFLALSIPHLSAYHLIYEEGTALTKLVELGKVLPVSEEDSLTFFQLLIDKLRNAGYEHYEISNFALPDCYARHNTGYWQGKSYLGLGPSAHSFDGQRTRSYNPASLKGYVASLLSPSPIRSKEVELLTDEELQHEHILTRLRTQWGISLPIYTQLFGESSTQSLLARATPHLQTNKLHIEEEHLRLTSQGIFVSDGIFTDLFV